MDLYVQLSLRLYVLRLEIELLHITAAAYLCPADLLVQESVSSSPISLVMIVPGVVAPRYMGPAMLPRHASPETTLTHRRIATEPTLSCTRILPRKFRIDTNFVPHYYCAMKDITITLDEEVARWARIRAAESDTSLSRLVGEMLREKMLDESNYRTSMQNYLHRSPRVLKKTGDEYPDREALHGRKSLR